MCIRDRVTISKDGDDNPSSEITPGQVLCYAYSDPGTELACLLYTSDAADDLLCVDLGGRRIIKKKKQ